MNSQPLPCPRCGNAPPTASRFCNACGFTLAAPAPAGVEAAAFAIGERRLITVLFADLVDSIRVTTAIGLEDLQSLHAAYRALCRTAIEAHGGVVAQFLGDGALAYFGYPRAREDDAERALAAALRLVAGIKELAPIGSWRAELRIGIATGLVADGARPDTSQQGSAIVVGETPNVAARLQGIAAPGTIVVDETTRRLIGTLFEAVDLGARELKGFPGPVRAWQVLGERQGASRFEALRSTPRDEPHIGRREEMAELLVRWDAACSGRGSAVVIGGEAGIGKSRLVSAFRSTIAGASRIVLRYSCAPQRSNTPLHPFVQQLERALGFRPIDDVGQRRAKIEHALSAFPIAAADLDIINDLMRLKDSPRAPGTASAYRKEETIGALIRLIEAIQVAGPLLVIFEDVHWCDPTSLEVIAATMERVGRLRLMALITMRPDFNLPVQIERNVSHMGLRRLTGAEAARFVARLTRGRSPPADLVERILARADGVPLFIEELVRGVLEPTPGDNRSPGAARPASRMAIPATLSASLMWRLDRVSPLARRLGQIASVIGRSFAADLLAALAVVPERELAEALGELVRAQLLVEASRQDTVIYTFHHELVREAAYDSLLRPSKQAIHASLARLLTQSAEAALTDPAIIAHHFTESANTAEAIRYWRLAGEAAMGRSAMKEAGAHFDKALALVEALPDDSERTAWSCRCISAAARSCSTPRPPPRRRSAPPMPVPTGCATRSVTRRPCWRSRACATSIMSCVRSTHCRSSASTRSRLRQRARAMP